MTSKEIQLSLPHSIDAERAVLGALLMDNDAINVALEILHERDFHSTGHAVLFATMIELYEEQQKFDVISLTDKLSKKKKLGLIGGASYIASLLESIPTAANISHHAEIVSQKALTRQLLFLGNKVVQECSQDSEPIQVVLDKMEQDLFKIGERRSKMGVVHIRDVIQDNFEKLDQLSQRDEKITGIPSGFPDLDELTSGFQNSDLIIVAARPSVGKTSFLLNIAEHIGLEQGIPLLFFSLEMSKESIATRFLSSVARVSSQKMRTGRLNKDDWARLKAAGERLYKAPIFIDDTPGMNILEMRAKTRRQKALNDIKIVFIDYLQLVRGVGDPESRQLEISQISAGMKGLAKEMDIPIVVCSQLSREVEKRREKEPKLSDLRESGSIEQDGDVIGFLHRNERDDDITLDGPTGNIQFILGKQRNGPIGSFELVFIKEYTRFGTIARQHQDAPSDIEMDETYMDQEPPF